MQYWSLLILKTDSYLIIYQYIILIFIIILFNICYMMKETIKKSYQKILHICGGNLFSTLNYIDKETLNEITWLKDFSPYLYREAHATAFIKDLRINDLITKIILKYLQMLQFNRILARYQ